MKWAVTWLLDFILLSTHQTKVVGAWFTQSRTALGLVFCFTFSAKIARILQLHYFTPLEKRLGFVSFQSALQRQFAFSCLPTLLSVQRLLIT